MWLQALIESGRVPDLALRLVIRRLLAQRLRELERGGPEGWRDALASLRASMCASPIALHTREANEQHYEVPAAFYEHVLGPHLKYSSGLWEGGARTLGDAEAAMLALSCARARLADGQRVLELGCGWGSLTLWMAERFPTSRILAVSNSRSQAEAIRARCARRNLTNVEVETADMNAFRPQGQFDRVMSVEMFEHMRNWQELLARIAGWLAPDGQLFVHVFTHARHAYVFETEGATNWLGRTFFTGGLMPSAGLLQSFDRDLEVLEQWHVDGRNYGRTAEAWLANLDRNQAAVLPILRATYGAGRERAWLENWRVFFLACAELWNYRQGSEWGVTHYRLAHRRKSARRGG
jgi:cyclopropane-fatty-acyl-phospholipid synthase